VGRIFEEFVLTFSFFPTTRTMRVLTQAHGWLQGFPALFSLSRTTHIQPRPCSIWLTSLRKLQEHLRGYHWLSDGAVKTAVRMWCR
jgi:hypothetical protein